MSFLIAAIVNLNHPGHYIIWHWLQISVANLVVISTMVVVFIVALFAPFPGRRRRGGA
jgi:drug/metabolite transporter superfamily protein YnfA